MRQIKANWELPTWTFIKCGGMTGGEEVFQFLYCPGMVMFEGVADDGV